LEKKKSLMKEKVCNCNTSGSSKVK